MVNPNDDCTALELSRVKSTELVNALNEWWGIKGTGLVWRPISDPPDAGETVLLYGNGLMAQGHQSKVGADCWPFHRDANVTHWAPIPKPPVVKS
jgi:hypothetical protein